LHWRWRLEAHGPRLRREPLWLLLDLLTGLSKALSCRLCETLCRLRRVEALRCNRGGLESSER